MTTTVAPDLKPGDSEIEASPTLDPNPAEETRHEPDARSFDPTQGRQLGSDPYDDPTQGRQLGSGPHDDPSQGRQLGSDPYDDPTRGRKIGSDPYDDPTRARPRLRR
jgi:hypothetical protein